MNITIFESYEALSRAAAGHVLDLVRKKPKCTLGLATGKTPIVLYRTICQEQAHLNLEWKHAKVSNHYGH